MAHHAVRLFSLLSLFAPRSADQVSYSWASDVNLIPTKAGEIHGANKGDIMLFGGNNYQVAVGDVDADRVVIYGQHYFFSDTPTTTWSEQAILVATEAGVTASNNLGFAIDAFDDVLMASAPSGGNGGYGGVFVFHDNFDDQWTQVQNLLPQKKTASGNFGYDVGLNNNGTLAIIGEPDNDYVTSNAGAAYIYGSVNSRNTYWTQLQELYPENSPANSYFGAQVEMFGKYAAVTSPAACEIYIFEEDTPPPKPCPSKKKPNDDDTMLSLKVASVNDDDDQSSSKNKNRVLRDRFLHWSLKQILRADDCSAGKDNMEIAFDEGRLIVTDKAFNTDFGKIFTYEIVYRNLASCLASRPSASSVTVAHTEKSCGHDPHDCRSEQFAPRTTIPGTFSGQNLGSAVALYGDIMVVSSTSGSGTVYIYQRSDAVTWNIIQTITNPDIATTNSFGVHSVGISRNNEILAASLTGAAASTGTTNLYSYELDSTWSCMVIAMYDLFGDGWNGAQLRIKSSTGKYDYYFPRNAYRTGFSQNPTYVRYCPDDWETSTYTYIDIDVPHALDFPYHWEIKWMVYFENTRQWNVIGNHATKAHVQFSNLLLTVELNSVTHPYNDTDKCEDNCVTFDDVQNMKASSVTEIRSMKRSVDLSVTADLTKTNDEDGSIDVKETISAVGTEPIHTRHLHGPETVAPSISPAPTFNQDNLNYDYPWIELKQDAGQLTGWFGGRDTGTQWFLSTGDGMHLFGTGTFCEDTLTEKICKLPLPVGVYPSSKDYVLRVTGDLDSRSQYFSYFFCGKTGAAPSHMDFIIDTYSQYLDGKCIGNNYFTLDNYVSATLEVDVVLQGVLSLMGYKGLTDLTDVDLSILRDVLRNTVKGDSSIEVEFHTYEYYAVKKLAFVMHIPTAIYNLNPRDHSSVNATYKNAASYLKMSSQHHSMGEQVVNRVFSLAQSGLSSTFTTLLTIEVSELNFAGHITRQRPENQRDGNIIFSPHDGHDDGDAHSSEEDSVSFVEEESPSLNQTLLKYANMKFGAIVLFALGIIVFLAWKKPPSLRRSGVDETNDSSSLLDVSNTNSKKKKKRRKHHHNKDLDLEAEGLLSEDIDMSLQSVTKHRGKECQMQGIGESNDEYFRVSTSTDIETGEDFLGISNSGSDVSCKIDSRSLKKSKSRTVKRDSKTNSKTKK